MSGYLTLKAQYETLMAAEQGASLMLSSALTTSPSLNGFLDSLPESAIHLEETVISLDDSAVTVTGAVVGSWAVRGVNGGALRDISISLVFTGEGGDTPLAADLQVGGNFFINGKPVSLAGALGEGNALALSLAATPPDPFSLKEIADTVSNGALTPVLPSPRWVNPAGLFDELGLAGLDLRFGFEPSVPTGLSAYGDGKGKRWIAVPGLLELAAIETAVAADYTPLNGLLIPSCNGSVTGLLPIGGVDYAIDVAFFGGDFWEMSIAQADGGSLPGLYDLARFVGGESLADTVRSGLQLLGLDEIAIDGVKMGFDLAGTSLKYVSMESHVELFGARINLYTTLPDFSFGGSLDDGSRITLKQFVHDYFGASDNFPELDITEYSFSATPGAGSYATGVMIESDWEFEVLPGACVALTSVELAVDWANDGTSTAIGGYLSCLFAIAGVSFFVEAEQAAGSGAQGWSFAGRTGADQSIPIGALFNDIAALFGGISLPSVIADLVIRNLAVTFNTTSKDFTFTCQTLFPVGDQEVDMTLAIACVHGEEGSYRNTLSGTITLADLIFDLTFGEESAPGGGQTGHEGFTGAFHQEGGTLISIRTLMGEISTSLASIIPASLSLTLVDTLFAYYREVDGSGHKGASKFIFGLDLGGGLNLSNLPQVGQAFPPDQTLAVDDLRFLSSSASFSPEQVAWLNSLVPEGVIPLPEQSLSPGLSLSATMRFGRDTEILDLAIADQEQEPSGGGDGGSAAIAAAGETGSEAAPSCAYWYDLQKSFGPVYFDRLGVEYRDEGDRSTLWFLMDAALANSTGTLSLSLLELGFGSPLTRFDPAFDLRGIGIEYRSKTLSIAGELLKTAVSADGETWTEYQGAAVLKANTYSLSAMGSYSEKDGNPCLFIYAFLDKPLGGPPCFFVTGLAAGLGYNRSLKTPPIEAIDSFPLVQEAMNGSGNMDDLMGEMEKLQPYLSPDAGKDFLAFGVKFNSFKIIDSFALFLFIKGDHEMIKILGTSQLVMPPQKGGAPALAVVKMNLDGTIDPVEGLMGIQGQLTADSYVFSRKCALSGGFAFYNWVSGEHAGDFVATIGGYHPEFVVPAHYPTVPRLSFDWTISDSLSATGEIYFALTAHALMAGGKLKATWESDGITAWFTNAADFIIAWKPYHYDAKIHISVGCSYRIKVNVGFAKVHKTIRISVGADLHLWGPEFSGKARVKCSAISFTIAFGSGSASKPKAIDWDEFKGSFLPAAAEVIAFAVVDGLLNTVKENKDSDGASEEVWIVNPKVLAISIDSAIPLGREGKTGIGSMEVAADSFDGSMAIAVFRQEEDGGWQRVDGEFTLSPLVKDVAAGLWGGSIAPKVNDASLIRGVATGYLLAPAAGPIAGETRTIAAEALGVNIDSAQQPWRWGSLAMPGVEGALSAEERRAAMAQEEVSAAISGDTWAMLQALGMDPGMIDLTGYDSGDFLGAPQIEASQEQPAFLDTP